MISIAFAGDELNACAPHSTSISPHVRVSGEANMSSGAFARRPFKLSAHCGTVVVFVSEECTSRIAVADFPRGGAIQACWHKSDGRPTVLEKTERFEPTRARRSDRRTLRIYIHERGPIPPAESEGSPGQQVRRDPRKIEPY